MFRFYPVHNPTTFDVFREFQRNFEELGLRKPVRLFESLDLGPRVQKSEHEDKYQLRLEVPGIQQDDVNVTVEKDLLTIEGTREQTIPEGFEVIRQERSAIEFTRKIRLPENIDQSSIHASFENGLLTVSLPKKAKEKPRQIKVNAMTTEEK